MNKGNGIYKRDKENRETDRYLTGNMDRNTVTELLRKEGFRITRQREILIDIILKEECTCCKEIYYLASKKCRGIGVATIYRTLGALEKIGALRRKNAYQLCCHNHKTEEGFLVELEDSSVVELDSLSMRNVVEKGLQQCGYSRGKKVKAIRYLPESE